jgi:interleukin-1 receptor-associated kinase 4
MSIAADAGGTGTGNSSTRNLLLTIKREINVLSSFNHPNIIRLLGYSLGGEHGDPSNMCLVYAFAAYGGLHKVLAADTNATALTWRHRLQVAPGVVKGLSYMHNRDTGRPAYHRDIKAANIALTESFAPKIIDCGLAKYVPEDISNVGMSIRTGTGGGRFGTIGYICPKYNQKADMLYDAKCEIYSFGILLLEIITGRIQNHPDLLDDLLDEERIVPDVRAGQWPVDTAKQLIQLAADCIEKYHKRLSNMLSVLRTLKNIEELHPRSALEASMLQAQDEVAAEVQQLRLHRDIVERRELALRGAEHTCCVCMDTFPLSQGVLCAGSGDPEHGNHFFCNSDLNDMISSQCSDINTFVRFGCKVVCCVCLATPVAVGEPQVQTEIDLSVLGAHASKEALVQFVVANRTAVEDLSERRRVAESALARERHADELQALRDSMLLDREVKLASSVQRHRLRIIDDILTLKCPHCSVAMLDFDGCFSVEHRSDGAQQQGCGRHFCGWCLNPFEGSGACHAHVKMCARAPARNRGSYHGSKEEFHQVQSETRRLRVLDYLQRNVSTDEEKQRLCQALVRDLTDLAIVL